MQDKLRLKGRLKCFSFTPISEWVLRHGNELGETRKFGSPWLGFVPQRISHHSLAIATHTLLFHSAIFLCLFVCVNQRLPPIELFSAIDYHMLIANISLPLCAAVLISTQKNNWESIKSTWELCLCVWWVHVIYVREACPRHPRLFFTSAKRGWEGV